MRPIQLLLLLHYEHLVTWLDVAVQRLLTASVLTAGDLLAADTRRCDLIFAVLCVSTTLFMFFGLHVVDIAVQGSCTH